MRKTAAVFIMALLITATTELLLADSATANPTLPTYLPTVTINGDGTIKPETPDINRTGNVYTLTADIIDEYSIDISCNDIVFDGAGHTINISKGDNTVLRLNGVTNVTVKNLEVEGRHNVIHLDYCSNSVFKAIGSSGKFIFFYHSNSNVVAESILSIGFLWSENNQVLRNNITALSISLSLNNNFSQNNILRSYAPNEDFNSTDHWDNGTVGNYWNDYRARYPNASEIGHTGIGDVPYMINKDNIDHYPLMYPYDIENDVLVNSQPKTPEPFPIVPMIAVSAASTAAVAAGLLLLARRKRRKEAQQT